MRKLLIGLGALAAAGALAAFSPADAGHRARAFLCWTAVGGYTDCSPLPAYYYVPGVRRPTCCRVPKTDRSDFYLTRRHIRALARQGVRVDTMAPGAWAQIQAVCRKHKRKHY